MWDKLLLQRGYLTWHCYGCRFWCNTQGAAEMHLRTARNHEYLASKPKPKPKHDDPEDFEPPSESVSMPDLIVADYPDGLRLEDRA